MVTGGSILITDIDTSVSARFCMKVVGANVVTEEVEEEIASESSGTISFYSKNWEISYLF